jgi:hypothetical protein
LIDYPSERIGPEAPQAWQVSVSGERLTTPVTFPETSPTIGVPGGLATESDSGISIVDGSDLVVEVATGPGFVSDVSADQEAALAWCDDKCEQLHIHDIASGEEQTFSDPGGGTFIHRTARFSPDGRYLAAPTTTGDIVLYDRDAGRPSVAFSIGEPFGSVQWSSDGRWLIAGAPSGDDSATRVAIEELETDTTLIFSFPGEVGSQFVVVGENEARQFLANSPEGEGQG